jgi:predicted Rossmann fold nucleotide-binding protein DprA/Smf involved in DNA uptake
LKQYSFSKTQIEKILENYNKINLAEIKKYLEKYSAHVVMHNGADYPESLHHISNPPFLMYVQ